MIDKWFVFQKIAKMMKRKRDAAATKEKKKSKAVDKFERAETEELEHKEQVVDDYDPLAAMRLRLDMVLERYFFLFNFISSVSTFV